MPQPDRFFPFLNSSELTAAAVSTGAITIPARQSLWIDVTVTGFNVGDLPVLRFNADSGANYSFRGLSCAAGGVTLGDNPGPSRTSALLLLGSQTVPCKCSVFVTNALDSTKVGIILMYAGTGAAATVPQLFMGGFEWMNIVAQITSIELRSNGGTNTLNAGSGFSVYGRDNR